MLSFTYGLFLILGLIIPSVTTWAQASCPSEFSQISTSCIVNSSNVNYSEKPIALDKNLKDDIFFYKTPAGQVGKLRVISALVTKDACTLYLDAVTYGGEKTYIPNSSITIGVALNNWLKERIYLDSDGSSALELIRHTPLKKDSSGNVLKDENDNPISAGPPVCIVSFSKGVQIGKYYDHKNSEQNLWKEEYDILYYVPFVLIFISIFILVNVFMEERDKFKTQEALEDAENSNKVNNQPFFIKITRPFYKRYFLPLTQGKNKQKYRNLYRQKLANAGLTKELTPEEFMALKLFMILGGPFAFLTVRYVYEASWPLSVTPIMGIVGFIYPDIWLSGVIKKRSEEILRAMPFIVDMLALSVEAGLDFMAAIQRVIEKAPKSPLVEEFETLIKETKIGSSRSEGLRQLGYRVNVIEINSFCATLIAADSVGASIGPLLKQLSNDLRVKRSSRAEQLGATAATKMLIPMIMFILPAVLIAIFAPMILKMFNGGST